MTVLQVYIAINLSKNLLLMQSAAPPPSLSLYFIYIVDMK